MSHVVPFRCDVCGVEFPMIYGRTCSRCGRVCCDAHIVVTGDEEPVCTFCKESQISDRPNEDGEEKRI